MTYSELMQTPGLTIAQRGMAADHATTIIEYLGNAALNIRNGLSLGMAIRTALADSEGVWPDASPETEPENSTDDYEFPAFPKKRDSELDDLLNALDSTLATKFPACVGLALSTDTPVSMESMLNK